MNQFLLEITFLFGSVPVQRLDPSNTQRSLVIIGQSLPT